VFLEGALDVGGYQELLEVAGAEPVVEVPVRRTGKGVRRQERFDRLLAAVPGVDSARRVEPHDDGQTRPAGCRSTGNSDGHVNRGDAGDGVNLCGKTGPSEAANGSLGHQDPATLSMQVSMLGS
jgi:hypothetical protein